MNITSLKYLGLEFLLFSTYSKKIFVINWIFFLKIILDTISECFLPINSILMFGRSLPVVSRTHMVLGIEFKIPTCKA